MPGQVAYNPSDPVQQSFLSDLALGETGVHGTYTEGFGGVDLAGATGNQYGFPTWGGSSTGAGPTHAAGLYQFEPGTWDSIAANLGITDFSPNSQNEAAWTLAQQTYGAKTGGASLEAALQSGNYSSIQSALASVWPSVVGNASNPGGLANLLASGGAGSQGVLNPGGATAPTSGGASQSLGFLGSITDVEQFFVRFGLVIIGGLIVLVALWQLLSDNTDIPSPGDTVSAAGHAATMAVAAV